MKKQELQFIDKKLCHAEDTDRIYEPQLKEEEKNKHNSKKVFCEDRIFESLKSCADFYNIKNVTMCAWLTGRNKMPDCFKEKGLRYLEEGDAM